ncbi:MAG: cysteine desulfurase NifS [Candidatus Thermoplasmatota archaeon]|nr:cysteine desulfurase NifS [Candidatus Thermoplasmatota archaeon]
MKHIYLDHAATTPVDPDVLDAMLPYFTERYGNASSLHGQGAAAKRALDESREQVASLIGADPDEVIFTGSGTESDNLAVKGVAMRHGSGHIITSQIEHPAVLQPCEYLENKGFDVTYLPVDKHGLVDPSDVDNAIRDDTRLVSIMHANNEIGTVEPVREIVRVAHEHEVPVHTDAVQTVGKIPVDIQELGVDMLSLSAHKIYGPKGVGALYIREGTQLEPLLHGGGHEHGLRSSTENIPGVVGLGTACQLAKERLDGEQKRLTGLRDRLIDTVLEIEEAYLNGHPEKRLPNNAHFRFTAIEGESLLLSLDEQGIAASTGSACSSKKLQASHVLLAIGLDAVEAHGSLRLTLGKDTTEEDVDIVLQVLPGIIERLREMSPLWSR